jgi:hypothetical protein
LLIAHPVGDGNALELESMGTALMDCGGDIRASEALHSASARGMSEFLLTHLHLDHYSGITSQTRGTKLSFDVKNIFFPALPLIDDQDLTKEFALALFTLNKILGSGSGIPEQDLVDKFLELNPNNTQPSHRSLLKGDVFNLAGVPFEVLWPPRSITGLVAKSARDAVAEFKSALEKNQDAAIIRDGLQNSAEIVAKRAWDLASHNNDSVDISEAEDINEAETLPDELTDDEGSNSTTPDLPTELVSANDSIRGVANRLCLAFRFGHRFIHLGDLERAELNKVAISIGQNSRFFAMIAAHHGTHFSKNMHSLRVANLIVSNGKKSMKNFDNNYNRIEELIQQTGKHGHCFFCF